MAASFLAFWGEGFEESPDSLKQWCRVMPGRSNPTESATENRPLWCVGGSPLAKQSKGETVG